MATRMRRRLPRGGAGSAASASQHRQHRQIWTERLAVFSDDVVRDRRHRRGVGCVRCSCSTGSPLVALAEVAPWPPWRVVSAERPKSTTGRTPVRRLARPQDPV